MLLSRSLPPHFLLPAWSTRQLLLRLQRGHKSTLISKPRRRPFIESRQPTLPTKEGELHIRFYNSSNGPVGRRITSRRRIALERTKPLSSRLEDDGSHKSIAAVPKLQWPGLSFKEGAVRVRFHKTKAPLGVTTPPLREQRPIEGRKSLSLRSDTEESPKTTPSSQYESNTVQIDGPLERMGQWGSLRGSLVKDKQVLDNRATMVPGLQKAGLSQSKDNRSDESSSLAWCTRDMEGPTRGAQQEQTKHWISLASDEGAAESSNSARFERAELKEAIRKDERSHNGTPNGASEQMESASLPTEDEPTYIDKTKPQRTKPTTSLFDELFPEEAKTAKQSETKIVEKLPAFEWHDGPKIDWKTTVENAAEERKNWFHAEAGPNSHVKLKKKEYLGVLVLSGASKTLEESDFFRLGSKGEHIEGWTSGIIKVIQGRDTHTLEPLGYYFLIFSNEAAASAYLDNTRRLHTLSKTHGTGGSLVPLPAKYLRQGEDLKTVLRGYSLVPGQSKLSLRLLNRPHSPAVAQILRDGGPAAIARQKTNSENMVLLSTDFGQISHFDLQAAISGDGHERNLHWKFIDGERAIVKVNSDPQGGENEPEGSRLNGSHRRRNARSPSRYILSFKDSHEARRFVREWHRRPLPLRMERKVSDEPPPIINAEMFW